MSREIKFRYIWKRKSDGHLYTTITPIECLEDNGDTPFLGNNLWLLVARSQFTGLKDKNGVEIYEGDILHAPANNTKYVVEFGSHMDEQEHKQQGFYIKRIENYKNYKEACGDSELYLTVIGNIYENLAHTPKTLLTHEQFSEIHGLGLEDWRNDI